MIPRLADEGRAVLLASHLLHEVEQVCDRVTIIRRGRLVQTGDVRQLLQRGAYLEVGVAEPERAMAVLARLPVVERIEPRAGSIAVFVDPASGAAIVHALADARIYPHSVVPHVSTLEDVFLELTDDHVPVPHAEGPPA